MLRYTGAGWWHGGTLSDVSRGGVVRVRVVAISRQLAAGATEIGRILAPRLTLPLLEQEIIDHAAAAAGVSAETLGDTERVPPLITRIVEQLGRYPLVYEPESSATLPLPSNVLMTSSDYRRLIDDVIRRIADQQEAVIIGHGAGAVLGARPDVLRVFIYAPVAARTQRLMHEEAIPQETARRRVEESDRVRAEFFRHYYNIDWLQGRHHDLMLNTSRYSDDAAARIIEAVVRGEDD